VQLVPREKQGGSFVKSVDQNFPPFSTAFYKTPLSVFPEQSTPSTKLSTIYIFTGQFIPFTKLFAYFYFPRFFTLHP